MGHKKGYNMKDATGKLAPIVPVSISTEESGPAAGASDPISASEAQRAEMQRLGYDPFGRLEDPVDGGDIPTRGLGKGYEAFDDEIHTDIDALKLVHFLKETGFEVNSDAIVAPSATHRLPRSDSIIHLGHIHIYGRRPLFMRLHLLLLSGGSEKGK
jgi:hypothetical protein